LAVKIKLHFIMIQKIIKLCVLCVYVVKKAKEKAKCAAAGGSRQ
jgi:hypothetical protein